MKHLITYKLFESKKQSLDVDFIRDYILFPLTKEGFNLKIDISHDTQEKWVDGKRDTEEWYEKVEVVSFRLYKDEGFTYRDIKGHLFQFIQYMDDNNQPIHVMRFYTMSSIGIHKDSKDFWVWDPTIDHERGRTGVGKNWEQELDSHADVKLYSVVIEIRTVIS